LVLLHPVDINSHVSEALTLPSLGEKTSGVTNAAWCDLTHPEP
jgi:hypothetical protein